MYKEWQHFRRIRNTMIILPKQIKKIETNFTELSVLLIKNDIKKFTKVFNKVLEDVIQLEETHILIKTYYENEKDSSIKLSLSTLMIKLNEVILDYSNRIASFS
jgi:hypothetical protein